MERDISLKTYTSPLVANQSAAILDHLRRGHVGLFPTDTVYGIGCRADWEEGTERIFDIKGRDFAKTLPILIGDWRQFEEYASPLVGGFSDRLGQIWPGGLTVVVRASKAGLLLSEDCLRDGTVAVRMPAHQELRRLIVELGVPLAATSANLSGEREHLDLLDISAVIRNRVDWEWEEKIPKERIQPSTVVDLTGPTVVVLRQGEISF